MNQFLMLFNQNTNGENILNARDIIASNGGTIKQIWDGTSILGEGSHELQSELKNIPDLSILNEEQQPDFHSLNISENAKDLAEAWALGKTSDLQNEWDNFWSGNSVGANILMADYCGGGIDPADNQIPFPFTVNGLLGFVSNQQLVSQIVNHHRRSLAGTIGITIFKVEGPPGSSAVFTLSEWFHALLTLSRGLNILQTLAPPDAHLVFDIAIRRAAINLDPNSIPFPADLKRPTIAEYELIESLWRNPALAQFGAVQSQNGYDDLVTSSKFQFNIEWGFVFVLTKYRTAYPGYSFDYRNVIISYSEMQNLPNLPAIFAHEIGHTTGALDEYSPNCSPFHLCGFTKSPNLNCETANPWSVNCLMKNLKPVVCPSTRNHFGWGDQNNDGVLDPFDPNFVTI